MANKIVHSHWRNESVLPSRRLSSRGGLHTTSANRFRHTYAETVIQKTCPEPAVPELVEGSKGAVRPTKDLLQHRIIPERFSRVDT